MGNTIAKIEQIVRAVGKFSSWFNLLLVILICLDVCMRYLFNFSVIWVIELETYFFAIIFLLGSGYAFQQEKHVRVDIFYQQFSEKRKAWINLLGGLLFLIPWCIILVYVGSKYGWMSFKIRESSSQPGGLPAIYILKSFISICFVLLLLQGLASITKSVLTLRRLS